MHGGISRHVSSPLLYLSVCDPTPYQGLHRPSSLHAKLASPFGTCLSRRQTALHRLIALLAQDFSIWMQWFSPDSQTQCPKSSSAYACEQMDPLVGSHLASFRRPLQSATLASCFLSYLQIMCGHTIDCLGYSERHAGRGRRVQQKRRCSPADGCTTPAHERNHGFPVDAN